MIVDSASVKHHTVTNTDVDNCVLLFRSRVGHCDEVSWGIIITTHPALAKVPVGGVMCYILAHVYPRHAQDFY